MKDQGGTTLAELMFVLAISGFVIVAVARFVFSSRQGALRQENSRDLLSINQRMGNNIRSSLSPSSILLGSYPAVDFSGLQSMISAGITNSAAAGVPQKVSFSNWPIVADGKPELDGPTSTAAVNFGNELSFVAVVGSVTFTAIVRRPCASCTAQSTPVTTPNPAYTPFASTTPNTSDIAEPYNVERVQFVNLYLTQDLKKRVNGLPGTLRVVEWRSKPYVSYTNLTELYSGPQLLTTCKILSQRGYDYAIDLSRLNDIENAFYKINTSGVILDNTVAAPAFLPMHSWSYLEDYDMVHSFNPLPNKVIGKVSRYGATSASLAGASDYSIAYNTLSPSVNPFTKVNGLFGSGGDIQVPAFAQLDKGGAKIGFPGGFEVAIIGRSGARQVMIRRVLMAASGAYPKGGPKNFQANEYIDYITVNSEY